MNALKTRSVIATPLHWRIFQWAYVNETLNINDRTQYPLGVQACLISHYENVSTNLLEWDSSFHDNAAILAAANEGSQVCAKCMDGWLDFVRDHGITVYRRGRSW